MCVMLWRVPGFVTSVQGLCMVCSSCVRGGAKHSPPVSDRGPICQKGGPPKSSPETPLTNVIICQIFTKSIIGNTDWNDFWCSFEWWRPHCLIRTGSLDHQSRFGPCRGQKTCFLRNRLVKFSDGLHITCSDSRTCFWHLTGVLVNLVRSTLLRLWGPSGTPTVPWPISPKYVPKSPFGWHQLHGSNLDHQNSIGRMSRQYQCKFLSWFWFQKLSFSLIPGGTPACRRGKIGENKCHQNWLRSTRVMSGDS